MRRAYARLGPPRFHAETRPRGVPIETPTRVEAAQQAPPCRKRRTRRGTRRPGEPRSHRRPTSCSVTASGAPEYPNPVGLRLTSPGFAPCLWHWQTAIVSSGPIEIRLLNHVLGSYSFGTQFASTNPASNRFRVATDPVSGARNRQHCSCILLHPLRQTARVMSPAARTQQCRWRRTSRGTHCTSALRSAPVDRTQSGSRVATGSARPLHCQPRS